MHYHNFFGIDIGKLEFVTAIHGQKNTEIFLNQPNGWREFFNKHFQTLRNSLVVLEATGGYENDLLLFLIDKGITVHRADARKVKNFIRSFGQLAKTDSIDSIALAKYAYERQSSLKPFAMPGTKQQNLKILEERRLDLTEMIIKEKNRLKAPLNKPIIKHIENVLTFLEEQLKTIKQEIKELLQSDPISSAKKEILQSIPGVGEVTASSLMAFLPELGFIDRKKIASLSGLAPHPRQSGTRTFYSRTSGGRRSLRPILFLAAMGARRTKSNLRDFYESMIKNGKKPMVALTALERKIVVIANAKIRDYLNEMQKVSS